jgi:hypothetical protein
MKHTVAGKEHVFWTTLIVIDKIAFAAEGGGAGGCRRHVPPVLHLAMRSIIIAWRQRDAPGRGLAVLPSSVTTFYLAKEEARDAGHQPSRLLVATVRSLPSLGSEFILRLS